MSSLVLAPAPPRSARRPVQRAAPTAARRVSGIGVPSMPGLDGVRALAVCAVVLYHAEVGWLPGGFLGVDVFFVLSGYLITALLVAEHRRDHHIDLGAFWRRRVRRLLPALVLVLAATLIAAAVVCPVQLPALRATALAALLEVANWHQILGHVSYFAEFGRPPLMRQLWSLSVEEQFYLLWPLAVMVALRWGRTRGVGLLALGIAGASTLELWLLAGSGSITRLYEGTDTRAATLAIGALLALTCPPGRMGALARRVRPVTLDLLGLAGAAGLAWLMATTSDTSRDLFPDRLLAVAVLAGALILAAAQPRGAVGWLLARRVPRWVGRRSYGIYLWHWPVIALTRSPSAGFGESVGLILVQITLSLVLAALSYRWVEAPIRRHGVRACAEALRRAPRPGRVSAVAGLGAVTLAVLVTLVLPAPSSQRGQTLALVGTLRSPTATTTTPLLGVPRHRVPTPAHLHVHVHPASTPSRRVRPAPVVSGPTMVFGDSVVIGAAPALTAALGPETRFNASIGRQPQDTIAAVGATRAAGGLPRRVVVSIGDNGVVTPAMMHDLARDVRGVPDVVVLTPRVSDPWGPESTTVIRAARHWWPQLRVADWDALSADQAGWFTDGVHPDATGITRFVALVTAALDRR